MKFCQPHWDALCHAIQQRGLSDFIAKDAVETLKNIGSNPLLLMSPPEDHPKYECPICCLNSLSAEHDRTCTDPACKKPKGLTFDDWIDKAADGAAEQVKSLMSK